MTIETTDGSGDPITKSGPYTGNGVTAVFDYDFQAQDESELLVTRQNADLSEDVLELTTDYTVSGVGDDTGGSITLVSPSTSLTTGEYLVIEYNGAFTQSTDYSNQGSIKLELLEQALDRVVMHLRQLKQLADRSVRVDPFGSVSIETLTANINTLADIDAALSTLAALTTELSGVYAIAADVTTVAGVGTEVGALGALTAEIVALDAVIAEMTALAAVAVDIDALGALATEITALGAIPADITAAAALAPYTAEIAALYANLAALLDTEAALSLVADLSPQLGADLDGQGNDITNVTLLSLGVNDTTAGSLLIYGAATTTGGSISIYTAGDQDANNNVYKIEATGEDFQITADGNPFIYYDDSLGRMRLNSAETALGTNDSVAGKLLVFGGGAGQQGGQLWLYAGADYDTTNDHYRITVTGEDLLIEAADGTDLLKLSKTSAQISNLKPTITRLTSGTAATHNLQATTKRMRIREVGGGGAGGGADSDVDGASGDAGAGGGGGSGAFYEFEVDVAALGISSFTYTVGTGGAGANNAGGGDGTSTSYSDGTNTVTAGGGAGGATKLDSAVVSRAGVGSGGAPSSTIVSGITTIVAAKGESGQSGLVFPKASLTDGRLAIGGMGGSTVLGPGGEESATVSVLGSVTDGNSAPTANSGAGGGGASATAITTSGKGGDGAAGVMIVEEYPY